MLYVHASPYSGGVTGGTPVSEMGLSGLSFVFQNQDDDYAEMRFRHTWKGNPPAPFDVDREVLFYEIVNGDYSRLFRGVVAKPSAAASGTTSSQSVVVQGPWHRFKQTPFVFMYPYITGNAASTHGILSGNINSLLTTIINLNALHIVRLGTIDVGDVTIPTTDVYNQSLAQVIKSILRYVPDAIVSFDHSSTSRPTINILSRPKSTHGMASFGLGSSKDLNVVPRYDRLVEGVYLQYEQTWNNKFGLFSAWQDGYGSSVNSASSPEVTSSGFWLAGTDTAGDMASRRLFRKTLRLDGYFDQVIYNWQGALWSSQEVGSLNGLAYPAQGLTGPGAWLWKLKALGGFMRLFSPATNLHINAPADYLNYNANQSLFGSVSITDRNYLAPGPFADTSLKPVVGFGPSWYTTPDVMKSAGASPGVPASSVPSVFFSGSSFVRAMTCTVTWNNFYQLQVPVGWTNFSAPNILFAQGLGTGQTFNYSKTVTTASAGALSGIAAKLLSANNRLLYDCSFTQVLPRDYSMLDLIRYFHRVRAFTLADYNYVNTPVQRVRINWFSRSYSVDCGAPEQLGPQDLIALAKAGETF